MLDENYKSLAALTVVRELYDQGKDVYDILAGYLKIVIISEKMNSFSALVITDKLNRYNSFQVNESVVKTALKRLGLERNGVRYIVDQSLLNTTELETLDKQIVQNNALMQNLFEFIENEKDIQLSASEKELIQRQFYNYLLNEEVTDEYSLLISKYIVKASIDDTYISTINRIKEGTLIYEGICYSPDLSSIGKWKTELNIYLELEILFFLVGFDGEIYKKLYMQLVDYVNEINSGGQKYIKLYYTQDVKEEFENFFKAAEIKFDKDEVVDPSHSAMLSILSGARSKSDIQTKRIKFLNELSRLGIKEDNMDFYSIDNQSYNHLDQNAYQEIETCCTSDRGTDYVHKCADKVNQIEILRKNQNIGINTVKNILLTNNGTILNCTYSPVFFKSGEVPKATGLDFLINKFWFELKKGFGRGETPKTIDIVSRARVVLASLTNNKVSKEYEELKKKFNNGEVDQVEVAGVLSSLRVRAKTPDEINAEAVDEAVQFLKDFDVNKKIEAMKREELEHEKDVRTIAKLQEQIKQLETDRESDKENQKKKENDIAERFEKLEKKYTESCDKNIYLQQQLEIVEQIKAERKRFVRRICKGLIFIAIIIIVCYVLYRLGIQLFKVDKSVSGIISIGLTIVVTVFGPVQKTWKKIVLEK